MREIKFRAWDEDENSWLNIRHFGFDGESLWYIQAIDENEKDIDPPYFVEYNEVKLMQYTGLKDKNGKEIYEGDIVQIKFYFGLVKFKVIFAYGGFYLSSVFEEDSGYSRLAYKYKDFGIEVIGNIYENPDLINK